MADIFLQPVKNFINGIDMHEKNIVTRVKSQH